MILWRNYFVPILDFSVFNCMTGAMFWLHSTESLRDVNK